MSCRQSAQMAICQGGRWTFDSSLLELGLPALPDQGEMHAQRLSARQRYEASLEAMQSRIDKHPEFMRIRRQTVEHPFGTIKEWMGASHFLTRSLKHVSTEMSLHVLAYNMKRVMKILGTGALIEAMRS